MDTNNPVQRSHLPEWLKPGWLLALFALVFIFLLAFTYEPVAALFRTVAKDGYSGSIHLLVGVKTNGELLGVRALAHKETPGLGDEINLSRSDWILGFNQRSLDNPILEDWAVKKDGGIFDAFTGATITPRAVVGEVKKTLLYFRDHQDELFQ